ncbi:MAG: NAD(P)-dependent alcohol dehydrogenase [Candidatus Bipolaricaulota bacterium]|nr:MAG: NAD(P)-dependent alcohol dehydrogenase [Candidatus Bipolaricaulota bacterium]
MKISAMAAAQRGAALQPCEYDAGNLGPHDCLIEVAACGLCHSDIHMIDDDWRISSYPLVPGHEIIGRVEETGSSVKHVKRGERIGIGWQRSSCLQCDDCLRGDENLCDGNQGVISHGHGGFAERLVMDSRFLFPIPEGITTDVAGPLLCGGITVFAALRTAGMTSGQRVGVIGVGGLGHLAVQFAAKLGNWVTVFTTSDDKAEFAARLGAHEAVVVAGDEPPRSSRRLDILLNTAPANLDWAAYLKLLDSDGTLTFVALPSTAMQLPVELLLFKRRRVMASPIGGRALMRDMLRTADTFGVVPLIEKFPLGEINTAIRKVRENTVRYRAVLMP